jgi:hypothetical protein
VLFRAFSVIFAVISQHMHNTFTAVLFIYIRLHVSALYGPSSGRYKLPSLQTKMRKILAHFSLWKWWKYCAYVGRFIANITENARNNTRKKKNLSFILRNLNISVQERPLPRYTVGSQYLLWACIATIYELDSPGIKSRWSEIFHTCPDRPWGPPSLL